MNSIWEGNCYLGWLHFGMGLLVMDLKSAVDGVVGRLVDRGGVVGVGLFGDLSKYEWSGSVVDVLVVGGPRVSFEFEEILEYGGLLFDVNHVPYRVVGDVVSPDLDHRLFELEVLFDGEGVLSRAKVFVGDKYRSRGRVEVRTDGYLTGADMYMSRAASALTRGDVGSAVVYGEAAVTPVAHLLMDVAGFPVTRGALVWNLRRACERLRLMDVFGDFLGVMRLGGVDVEQASVLLGVFEDVWGYLRGVILGESGLQVGMPVRMRRDIEYLTSPLLLRLIRGRVGVLLDGFDSVGAVFYLRSWLLPLLEAYAWVVSSARGDKFDYTGLFRVVRGDPVVYEGAGRVFGLGNVDARGLLVGVRDLIGRVRGVRNSLIDGYVGML